MIDSAEREVATRLHIAIHNRQFLEAFQSFDTVDGDALIAARDLKRSESAELFESLVSVDVHGTAHMSERSEGVHIPQIKVAEDDEGARYLAQSLEAVQMEEIGIDGE